MAQQEVNKQNPKNQPATATAPKVAKVEGPDSAAPAFRAPAPRVETPAEPSKPLTKEEKRALFEVAFAADRAVAAAEKALKDAEAARTVAVKEVVVGMNDNTKEARALVFGDYKRWTGGAHLKMGTWSVGGVKYKAVIQGDTARLEVDEINIEEL